MPARSECLAGVDHDREQAGRRPLPRRADPEAADLDRPVERAPALLPAVLDVGPLRGTEGVPEALLPARVGVGRELERVVVIDLLEAVREELDHDRPRLLAAAQRYGHRHAAEAGQRKKFRTRSKNPSSSERYVSSVTELSNSSSSSRWR